MSFFTNMRAFSQNIQDVLKNLSVTAERGLSEAEVSERHEKYGKNELPQKKGKSILMMFLAQLHDWLIYILFAAIILTIWHQEYIDAAIIFFVIIINVVLGVAQEYRAGKAVEILRNMTAPQAIVRRD